MFKTRQCWNAQNHRFIEWTIAAIGDIRSTVFDCRIVIYIDYLTGSRAAQVSEVGQVSLRVPDLHQTQVLVTRHVSKSRTFGVGTCGVNLVNMIIARCCFPSPRRSIGARWVLSDHSQTSTQLMSNVGQGWPTFSPRRFLRSNLFSVCARSAKLEIFRFALCWCLYRPDGYSESNAMKGKNRREKVTNH